MTAQAPAWGITDAQFFDQGGIVQSALLQIAQRLRVAIQLLLIEGSGLLEYIAGSVVGALCCSR